MHVWIDQAIHHCRAIYNELNLSAHMSKMDVRMKLLEHISRYICLVADVVISPAAAFVWLHEFRAGNDVRIAAPQRSNL